MRDQSCVMCVTESSIFESLSKLFKADDTAKKLFSQTGYCLQLVIFTPSITLLNEVHADFYAHT